MGTSKFSDTLIQKDEQILVDIYERAEKELIEKIEKVDFTKRAEKLKTLAQIRLILENLLGPSQKYVDRYSTEYWNEGLKDVDQSLKNIKPAFNLIDSSASLFVMSNVEDIQDQLTLDVRNTLNFAYTNLAGSINTAILSVKNESRQILTKNLVKNIATSQILGEARTKISNKIVNQLRAEGITALSYPSESAKSGERNLSLKAYAKSLARQTLINSRASAVIKRAMERGHDLVQISTHSNPSPMCQPWSGKIVSISGTSKDYPSLQEALFKGKYQKGGGIFWRWCRHSLTVYIESDIEFKD